MRTCTPGCSGRRVWTWWVLLVAGKGGGGERRDGEEFDNQILPERERDGKWEAVALRR